MCGISGFFNIKGDDLPYEALTKMLKIQHHRGPDFQGIYYNNYIGLAHNRLSLLDLSSTGNQPFQDDNYVLIYNGEIYNYKELKQELNYLTHTSSSDTAVLFQALKHWGVNKTVQKIKGMFAFSWYDKKEKELYLVRDRLGIKPMFYGWDSLQTLWFSSELKAISSILKCTPNPIKVLYSSLGVLERSRKETAWNEINHVTPGTYLKIDKSGLNEITYYTVFDTINENEYNRLNQSKTEKVLDEFEFLFKKSTKTMCVSDAPMGAFVSGGIDSSLISYYASENSPNIKLFTANVIGKYSEYIDAKLLASTLNKPLFDYKFEKEMVLRDWVNVTWYYESPVVVHLNAIPFSGVSMLAKEHKVKAVLTGEGADELFFGYSYLLAKRYDKFLKLPYYILNVLYSLIPPLKSYISKTGGSEDLVNVFHRASHNFSNEITFKTHHKAYDFLTFKDREEHLLTSKMLQDHIVSLLWRNDRIGMMHSIESRFPFLDEGLISFAMNLPSKYKIGNSWKIHDYKHPFLVDKFIVRKLAQSKLPKSLVNKKKNGFPMHGLRDILIHSEFFRNGFVSNIFQINQIQIEHMCSTSNNYITSLLASVEIWAKLFIEKKSINEVEQMVIQYAKMK